MKDLYEIYSIFDIETEINKIRNLITNVRLFQVDKIKLNDRSLRLKSVVIAGPWLGELGVMLIRWIPYLRWIREKHPDVYLIAGGYKNYVCLYSDFIDEYWVLPDLYKRKFLNIETSFNYSVLHEVFGNTEYIEHAIRKSFPSTKKIHLNIAYSWLSNIKKNFERDNFGIVNMLSEGRVFYKYKSTNKAKCTLDNLLKKKNIDPKKDNIVMFLPRLRIHQNNRSWSVKFYKKLLFDMHNSYPKMGIIIIGSKEHENKLSSFMEKEEKIINLISNKYSIDHQIAAWNISDYAIGPPSGGLVLAYIIGVPLLHMFKPNAFPKRKNVRWDILAEPDYISINGIKSEWIEVDENDSDIKYILDKIDKINKR
jgi:hypothetical protein